MALHGGASPIRPSGAVRGYPVCEDTPSPALAGREPVPFHQAPERGPFRFSRYQPNKSRNNSARRARPRLHLAIGWADLAGMGQGSGSMPNQGSGHVMSRYDPSMQSERRREGLSRCLAPSNMICRCDRINAWRPFLLPIFQERTGLGWIRVTMICRPMFSSL